ncbi:MAG: T9SS type A sorting domain-containing protein [Candidatus Hermodarchaeia archaeon]|jgi:hypothetical protein
MNRYLFYIPLILLLTLCSLLPFNLSADSFANKINIDETIDFGFENKCNNLDVNYPNSNQRDSLNVRLVSSWPSGNTNSVVVDGDRNIAFAGGRGSVYVLDVSEASDPKLLSEVQCGSNWIEDLFYLDGYLYVVEYWGMISIVSITDPCNPQVEGYWFSVSGGALSVAVKDTIACVGYDVTGGWGGTEIVSISDPSNIVFLSDYVDHGTAWQIVIKDSLVFVATEMTGLSILSISDPSNPHEVGRFGNDAYGVSLNDTIAYISDIHEVRAISVADPSNPMEIGSYSTPGRPWGIVTAGSMAYVADVTAGLRILSISDPANLEEVGYYQTIGDAEAVAYFDPYIYVGTDECLMILEYLDPSLIGDETEERSVFPKTFSLSQNYPNPFNPSTNIDITIPGSVTVRVRLLVYDLRGRMVRELLNEEKEPGHYSVWWDGTNGAGTDVGSGVYLYKLVAGNFSATKKMAILR